MKKALSISRKAGDRYITYLLLIVIFVGVQSFLNSGAASRSFKGLLIPTCAYILAAMALNLVVGVSGELSLGQAGFMCVGAFVGSLFSLLTEATIANPLIRFPLALLLGGVVAGIFGFLIGIPVLRLRGDYLAIVTLAFGEIIKTVFNNLYIASDDTGLRIAFSVDAFNEKPLAGNATYYIKGAQGINGTPQDSTFAICMIVLLIAAVIMLNFMDSKQGRAVMAARDNRIAAEAMGVNVTRAKMTAFVMSAFFGGVAGVLYSHNLNSLIATKFDYNLSILILVFVVLGGMNKMRGVMISTTVLYILPEVLRALKDYRMLIYAIVLIVMMLLSNSKSVRAFAEKVTGALKPKKKNQTGGAE